jgi:hypothetical protein
MRPLSRRTVMRCPMMANLNLGGTTMCIHTVEYIPSLDRFRIEFTNGKYMYVSKEAYRSALRRAATRNIDEAIRNLL